MTQPAPLPTICHGCKQEFPSKNAVFKHLKETEGKCLSKQEYDDFCRYVFDRNREKVVVLYGYWMEPRLGINNGQQAAQILLQVMENLIHDSENDFDAESTRNNNPSDISNDKIPNRSYGHHARSTEIVKQDDGMSAITEVLTTKLPQLPGGEDDAVEQWIQTVNRALVKKCQGMDCIRVLGRQSMPIRRFNAEMDVTHRRIEYLLPADFLFPSSHPAKTLPEFFSALPSFMDGVQSHNFTTQDFEHPWDESSSNPSEARPPNPVTLKYLTTLKKKMQSLTTHIVELNVHDQNAVFEKRLHEQKRQRNKDYQNNKDMPNKESSHQHLDSMKSSDVTKLERCPEQVLEETAKNQKCKEKKRCRKKQTEENGKKQNVLRRKRYHNFTPTVMAHEFLSYRRLDRFYHRGTFRFESNVNSSGHPVRPFLALSLSGDLFLNGQASRLVGLLIAIVRGVVDEDFVECVFDEKYPHLVPTPPAPVTGLYAADVHYVNAEGKAKAILTPRKCTNFPKGWHDENTLKRVREWQNVIRERTHQAWLSDGFDADGRLIAEKEWAKNVLLPWAEQAQKQVEEYRLWKASLAAYTIMSVSGDSEEQTTECIVPGMSSSLSLVPFLDSIDPTVPPIYEKVLHYLRKADESGLWPSTTLKRQLVMVAKVCEEEMDNKSGLEKEQPVKTESLAVSQMQIRGRKASRTSAYAFVEGGGGASGSFSVGAMPGDLGSKQPKNNALFPELMKAAFELEMTLRPEREPSSTIAINRNALFRPHTDSGAGAGQGTSLIVGLGTYSGGELMVEGEQLDIRYKPVEFNGWKQRHWTMPFRGERFSLVWFTPKGCEGIHGIDL
jgi:hypothetical protein